MAIVASRIGPASSSHCSDRARHRANVFHANRPAGSLHHDAPSPASERCAAAAPAAKSPHIVAAIDCSASSPGGRSSPERSAYHTASRTESTKLPTGANRMLQTARSISAGTSVVTSSRGIASSIRAISASRPWSYSSVDRALSRRSASRWRPASSHCSRALTVSPAFSSHAPPVRGGLPAHRAGAARRAVPRAPADGCGTSRPHRGGGRTGPAPRRPGAAGRASDRPLIATASGLLTRSTTATRMSSSTMSASPAARISCHT